MLLLPTQRPTFPLPRLADVASALSLAAVLLLAGHLVALVAALRATEPPATVDGPGAAVLVAGAVVAGWLGLEALLAGLAHGWLVLGLPGGVRMVVVVQGAVAVSHTVLVHRLEGAGVTPVLLVGSAVVVPVAVAASVLSAALLKRRRR